MQKGPKFRAIKSGFILTNEESDNAYYKRRFTLTLTFTRLTNMKVQKRDPKSERPSMRSKKRQVSPGRELAVMIDCSTLVICDANPSSISHFTRFH